MVSNRDEFRISPHDPSIERFRAYSDDELARLLAQLELARDTRLRDLIASISAELARRASQRTG
jgi:hypothetical protein